MRAQTAMPANLPVSGQYFDTCCGQNIPPATSPGFNTFTCLCGNYFAQGAPGAWHLVQGQPSRASNRKGAAAAGTYSGPYVPPAKPLLHGPTYDAQGFVTHCCSVTSPTRALVGNLYFCPCGSQYECSLVHNSVARWRPYKMITQMPASVASAFAALMKDSHSFKGVERFNKSCECGAAKVMGAKDYAPGHSDWCAVARKK